MTYEIISREMIRSKARAAYRRGAGRDDHGMNPCAPAVVDWQAEWDRMERALHMHAYRLAAAGVAA